MGEEAVLRYSKHRHVHVPGEGRQTDEEGPQTPEEPMKRPVGFSCDGVRATWLRDPLPAASSLGDHPAATPAATMPAMTVGAPSAELDLD
ncbi:hypothetical protein IMZ48_48605, partial [Candidatus Bathyarchaeota archaeon]|nr:hypothetical protein [Candidatus Bathyarchaeota archaeon]